MDNRFDLTYDNIQKESERFAKEYRKKHKIPMMPKKNELNKYVELLHSKFGLVVDLVKKRMAENETVGGHGFEHLEDVAARAGYIAEKECRIKKITGEKKKLIIESAVLAGVLHDVERHLGFEDIHMVQGEKTAKKILSEAGFENQLILTVVRNHDHIDFDPGDNKILSVVFGSVFDADHLRYGLEREDTFWRMKEKSGKPVKDVIHDYRYLPQWKNAWRTGYGKKIGPKYIEFGLAIAKHIEKAFSLQAKNKPISP
jgi:hypothetical protein